MPRRTRHRCLAITLLTVLAGSVVVLPAFGHAAGELPHARLSAQGAQVTVELTAAPDDAADVVVAAGLWPEEVFLAYLDVLFGGSTDQLPDAAEIAEVSRDPALARYLEDRVTIRQQGRACPGEAEVAANYIEDGATLTFTCPDPVTEAEVEITLLHDRDPAYRTFSVDGTAQYAVHTAARPAHPWDFTLAHQAEGGVRVAALLVGAAVVLLGAGAVLARLWSRPADGVGAAGRHR